MDRKHFINALAVATAGAALPFKNAVAADPDFLESPYKIPPY